MTVPTDTTAQIDGSASAGGALRRVLLVDAVTSGGVGLLLLAAAAPLSELWGFPPCCFALPESRWWSGAAA
jgi:hypothetical protein